ncbi:MAG: arsenic transporter [Thermobacillus sp. ZCTH02-B1]|uniref:arsenic transporter n=1 Tax=Thermobacillus sp. ZCTH02-B1 TaxID=1858795 RepID=UPI000B57E337|nr:arsenic transporter [Thermobacillus sp. ZCTH02-B1]OUM95400.1 MAG: arsenic transporter [Thermobacillus sp. ZCTH02-B1]
MHEIQTYSAYAIFVATITLLIWRPKGMSEAYPAAGGALALLLIGIVKPQEIGEVFGIVSGAVVTILCTIVMSIVLDSIGFFRWSAYNVIRYARGSGIRLYWVIMALCFLMTLFFNNDGSILITTPIIIQVARLLRLKVHQQIPYLIGGAMVATAASAPIGVSNLANLIALRIVGLDLNTYALLMIPPSLAGIAVIALVLLLIHWRAIPKRIAVLPEGSRQAGGAHEDGNLIDPRAAAGRWLPESAIESGRTPFHPLRDAGGDLPDWRLFQTCIAFVVLIRASLFAGEAVGIPIEWIAVAGAASLIFIRWRWTGIGPADLIRKTPWHILLFAFGVYVVVTGMRNAGLTDWITAQAAPYIAAGGLMSIMWTGGLLTLMSNLINNLPSVMIGTMALTDMGLDGRTLQIAYLANIIGSDVGSLLTPLGTLAALVWMFILKQHGIRFGWGAWVRTALLVIPPGLFVSLAALHLWTQWIG